MTPHDTHLPQVFQDSSAPPPIASPTFIGAAPEGVVAACLAGVVGTLPALNARAPDTLDGWFTRIKAGLVAARAADPSRRIAPFAVNQIAHASNDRLAASQAGTAA